MLERFTDIAKDLITNVKDLVMSLNHDEITNEHLLRQIIGLDNCLAKSLIIEKQVSWELINRDLDNLLKPAEASSEKTIGFDEYVKKSIESGFRKLDELNFKWLSSGIILLGMLDSGSDLTARLLKSWGFDSDSLTSRLIEIGDSSSDSESGFEIDPQLLKVKEMSSLVSEELSRVLSHASELAKSYDANEINFYHMLLSLVFMAGKEVIDCHPLDLSRLDLNKVKEIVSDKMSTDEKGEGRFIFHPRAHDIFKFAIQEAHHFGREEIGLIHFILGMSFHYPDEMKASVGYDLIGLKWQLPQIALPAQVTEVNPVRQPVSAPKVDPAGKDGVFPQISLRRYNADKSAVILVPRVLAEEWGVMALDVRKDVLTVAMLNPEDLEVVQKLQDLTHMKIAIVKTEERDLRAAFRINY